MLERFTFEYGNQFPDGYRKVVLNRVEQLYEAVTDIETYIKLREKGVRGIPYITGYLFETKEGAIRWAHHCLKPYKESIREVVRDEEEPRIDYYYTVEGQEYHIASVRRTGLIIEECNSEDW